MDYTAVMFVWDVCSWVNQLGYLGVKKKKDGDRRKLARSKAAKSAHPHVSSDGAILAVANSQQVKEKQLISQNVYKS